MEFNWIYQLKEPMTIRDFLKEQEITRNFMTKVKYHGGDIRVNNQTVTVSKELLYKDQLTIIAPQEIGHDTVPASHQPIEVVYEDRDCLVINKPANAVSIPSFQSPDTSIANRVKGYYERNDYPDQVIHIVTRLDRDTTGLMLIAKHRLAHAFFDKQLQNRTLSKMYYAISHKADWQDHGEINQPIARHPESIIQRRVHESGRPALTEYWVMKQYKESSLLKLQLHTGRTHQIRVHLAHEEGPLVGDTLYGGELTPLIQRQALHCGELAFVQPFTKELIHLQQPLPTDMAQWA